MYTEQILITMRLCVKNLKTKKEKIERRMMKLHNNVSKKLKLNEIKGIHI